MDSSLASRASAIPRYVALSGRTTTAEELNQLALDDYTNLVGQRTPEKQELAARLRAEAISLRTDKKRSGNTFSARATSGDMTLGSGARIDGYALVNLFASQNITIQGTIHIENTGANGAVNVLSKAALSADIVKAGAVGSQGTLVIHTGSNLDANALIKLFGGATAGGTIIFRGAGDVILTSGDGANPILISADAVEVETGTRLVTRSWVKTGNTWNRVDAPAAVYCNQCNWSASSGGDPAPGYSGAWTTVPNRAGPPPPDRSF